MQQTIMQVALSVLLGFVSGLLHTHCNNDYIKYVIAFTAGVLFMVIQVCI